MSITPLVKVTVAGLAADKPAVLAQIQRLGCLHLVSLRPPPAEPEKAPSGTAEAVLKALKYLTETPRPRRPVRADRTFDLTRVVAAALGNQEAVRAALDQRDRLLKEREILAPWGAFALPEPAELGGMRLWFYRLPLGRLPALRLAPDQPYEIVHRDHAQAWLVVLAPEAPPPEAVPVPRCPVGAVPLDRLQLQIEELESRLEDLAAEREQLSRWTAMIRHHLAAAEDQAALMAAAAGSLDQDGVFALQGWAPASAQDQLAALAARMGLALLVAPPDPTELPPTLLSNPPFVAGGQDLVTFFKTPGYRAWDPSTLTFWSVALFFAMITADAGYALALGAGLALVWRRLGDMAAGQRLRGLALVTVGLSVVYGALVGSWFGITPSPGSALAAVQVLDLGAVETMMQLSVAVGAGHVMLANLMLARHSPDRTERVRSVGWAVAVPGGLVVWLGPPVVGWVLVGGGLALVAAYGSDRRIDSWRQGLLRVLDGALALTNLSAAFGDVLSYLRLFALGLAGSSLAITFNTLAGEVAAALPGLGLFLGGLVLVAGHGLNLLLVVTGGVIHGLRLTYIEFFRWGLPDEGVPFCPFARKENV